MIRYTEDIYSYITKEMEDFYKKRTAKHIFLTQKYCKKIFDLYPDRFSGIIKRGGFHDASKYKNLRDHLMF